MKILLAFVLLVACAGASSQDAPELELLDRPGLPNLAHVEGNIYRGGRPDLYNGGTDSLRGLGVTKVIDLQGGDLTAPSKQRVPDWSHIILKLEPGEAPGLITLETQAGLPGIAVDSEPLDSLDPITPAEAERIDAILRKLHAADNPIYVHCEHGKDRTGLVIALYRVRYDGWTAEKAAAEMAAMGHTGHLDQYFTGDMDVGRVLAQYPALGVVPAASAAAVPPAPAPAGP